MVGGQVCGHLPCARHRTERAIALREKVRALLGITRKMVGHHIQRGGRPGSSRIRPSAALVIALLIVSTMTACESQDSVGQPRGPLTVEAAILGTGQERLDRLQQVDDLVAECMRRNGWEYTLEPVRVEGYQGFYDSLSSETASKWGYGITAPLIRGGEFDTEFGVNPNGTSQAQRDYADALEDDAYAQYMRDLSGARVSDAPEGLS